MSKLDNTVYNKYMNLDTNNFVQAEYVWIG